MPASFQQPPEVNQSDELQRLLFVLASAALVGGVFVPVNPAYNPPVSQTESEQTLLFKLTEATVF